MEFRDNRNTEPQNNAIFMHDYSMENDPLYRNTYNLKQEDLPLQDASLDMLAVGRLLAPTKGFGILLQKGEALARLKRIKALQAMGALATEELATNGAENAIYDYNNKNFIQENGLGAVDTRKQ
jgi:hypothetical protein